MPGIELLNIVQSYHVNLIKEICTFLVHMLGRNSQQISLKFLSTSIIHYTSCIFLETVSTMDESMELNTITLI